MHRKFYPSCNVCLHPSCHYMYHINFAQGLQGNETIPNSLAHWNYVMSDSQRDRLKVKVSLNKEFRKKREASLLAPISDTVHEV